ncbi:MAG: hypothetical protein PF484_01860 [Bacteroidales bacterium]|jgi:hypothetical protein|nr:hypothetical protein [Bacteroidales bacterium]
MPAISTIQNSITNSPLSLMIEKMGISIAQAQAALDQNSIEMLKELAKSPININGANKSLLELGFVPTFYAFTEASFEAKLEFSMAESNEFSIGGEVGATIGVVTASINASYARKFEQSASGSSSIAARMVSLPPPENLIEILKSIKPDTPDE